ncbi:binding-protein-dependent transport systems inner membrane component [Alkaliphilus metalliredigens QYMF]|uniref:Binding-protein-dependent transport systems inner membrane component n=1 Tax=Alkaliphilus metalliredigens (strain QYMF) TaxID=293826 RepID=A6TX90_ALKMQ|nr:carbohydrate ABC transporter permease [Alkaliphilus metalliredigens]ABR50808.1 binding-protein-dependent transport systems inner membrane component [Alkaliphilus metalliredigens QYMF]
MQMRRYIKKRLGKTVLSVILFAMVVVVLFPLVLTITNSFMSEQEIETSYSMVTSNNSSQEENVFSSKYANVKLIPDRVTITQYYTALIERTSFLIKFWNSAIIVVPIILGQMLVASMAAYAFAKIEFVFRDKLFFTYIIVMMMPFQVTLVPNYIMANQLGLIGSYSSIILPGIFGTFGVFLMRQFMVYIPDAYIESAKMDGASQFKIFFGIILPMSKTALAALSILVFIDNWNMVEQPLIFLQDVNMHPLSVYLSNINQGEMGIAFAASTIYMLPMLLIFLYGENYLVKGIQLSGLKG